MRTLPTSGEIPTHRVMIDRRTNREVGPRVPVDPDAWPFANLHPSEILWRYMNLKKFTHLMTTASLYFARQDRFKDPFEGRFSEGNSTSFSQSDVALHSAYNLSRTLEEAKSQYETHRRCVFISCWHRNTAESQEMWNAYTPEAESVVVTTSAKALYRFIPDQIMKSPVKYHSTDFARAEFGWNTLSFYKPESYGFEREFRMLRNLEEGDSVQFDNPADFGRCVPAQLKKIIHRVITHPKADEQTKQKVDALLTTHLKKVRRENSSLDMR